MAKKNYRDYFRLYSEQPGVTVQEHEEIFESVYRNIRKAETQSFLSTVSVMFRRKELAIAGLLLIATVGGWGGYRYFDSKETDFSGTFKARGGVSNAVVVTHCKGESAFDECRKKDILIFKVLPPANRKYFASFSRHIESNSVVWYFPASNEESSLFIENTNGATVLQQGISIGEEHVTGAHQLISIFSEHALSQEEIRKMFDEDGIITNGDVTVVRSIIRIEG